MTPHQSVPAATPAYDAFLFAPIGEEGNGMTLSVLSGLSRLGIDPWDEAAQLSLLPTERAIAALVKRIACLPLGDWQPSDMTDIASRLVALLPKPDAHVPAVDPLVLRDAAKKLPGSLTLWLIAAGIAAILLLGIPAHIERLLVGDSGVTSVLTPASRP